MRKTIIIVVFALLATTAKLTAQDYNTGIGLRGGLLYGITFKHFISEDAAIEAILASRWRGYNATVLYEKHAGAFDVDRLKWFYGAGGHIGSWRGYKGNKWFYEDRSYTVIGIDGIIGMEYYIKDIPFTIGIDWKPAFNLVGVQGFWGDEGAITVRYVF